jgi:anti-sigma factor RsiW
MNLQDSEQLSAYLDGHLISDDAARLDARLKSDNEMRLALESMRTTRDLMRGVRARRAPRNFTLTRSMVSRRPPLPSAYPFLQFATAAATLLLFATLGANVLVPRLNLAAAPAEYGVGGGGGGAESFAAEAPEAPASELTEPAAAPSLQLGQDAARLQATPQPKAAELEGRQAEASEPIRPVAVAPVWQIALGVFAIGCSLAALLIRKLAATRWRE